MPDPTDDKNAKSEKGGSLLVGAAVFLALTAGAVGGGWVLGGMLGTQAAEAKAALAAEATQESKDGPALALMALAPITTALAAPADLWVRLEASLLFAEEVDETVGEEIHQDILAFLRTIKPHQIETASGFGHLRADLDDLARIRSQGKVKGVLIRTLLFE